MTGSHGTRDLLEILRTLGGYYECSKDANGKRLGPLVGYAGRYDGTRQYVGDIYANFAMLERRPVHLHHFALQLVQMPLLERVVCEGPLIFCGAPEGGKALAVLLALLTNGTYVYPEKKVVALKTDTSREKSQLVWGRHEVKPGDRVVVVEDVMNNFSTTGELVQLIEASGGTVIMIAGLLNRSLTVGDEFVPADHAPIPAVALVRKPISEYRQDDPLVRDDVAAGNVVLKPKAEWPRLMTAMS